MLICSLSEKCLTSNAHKHKVTNTSRRKSVFAALTYLVWPAGAPADLLLVLYVLVVVPAGCLADVRRRTGELELAFVLRQTNYVAKFVYTFPVYTHLFLLKPLFWINVSLTLPRFSHFALLVWLHSRPHALHLSSRIRLCPLTRSRADAGHLRAESGEELSTGVCEGLQIHTILYNSTQHRFHLHNNYNTVLCVKTMWLKRWINVSELGFSFNKLPCGASATVCIGASCT